MDRLYKIRWFLYPSVFLLVFGFTFYFSFKGEMLTMATESLLVKGLYEMGPKKRGTPSVSLESASLWGIPGIKAFQIKAFWPAFENEQPTLIKIDDFRAKLGLFALLFKSTNIKLDMKLYEGRVLGGFNMNKNKEISLIDIDIKNLNFKEMLFLSNFLGFPLEGILETKGKIKAKNDIKKDGEGQVMINFKNFALGPGSVKIPGAAFMGAISVPKTSLGEFKGEVLLDKGEVSTKALSFLGGDLEGEISFNISLGPNANTSKLTGNGWFKAKPDFIQKNSTIKMLFDVIPELKSTSPDGKINFNLSGTLGQPGFGFQK